MVIRTWKWLNRRTVYRFVMEVIRRFNEDYGAVLAGYIAYSCMLAGFPFLIFAITLAAQIVGPENSTAATDILFDLVPPNVAQTLEPVLTEVLGQERPGLLTISAIGALYAASNGVYAIRLGLDKAYDVENHSLFIINFLYSVGIVLLGFVVFGILAVLIIFAPLIFFIFEVLTGAEIPFIADIARYALGGGLLYGLLWLLHQTLPRRPMGWKRLWPGILTSVFIWGLLATGMAIYVANTPSYTVTYGTLAGVIVTLLFFYLTGVAIIVGAEVNATINFGLPPLEEDIRADEEVVAARDGEPVPGDAIEAERERIGETG